MIQAVSNLYGFIYRVVTTLARKNQDYQDRIIQNIESISTCNIKTIPRKSRLVPTLYIIRNAVLPQ